MAEVKQTAEKSVKEMSVEDVCQWLQNVELGECIDVVRKEKIAGEHLQNLDRTALEKLGLVGPSRVRFVAAYRSLVAVRAIGSTTAATPVETAPDTAAKDAPKEYAGAKADAPKPADAEAASTAPADAKATPAADQKADEKKSSANENADKKQDVDGPTDSKKMELEQDKLVYFCGIGNMPAVVHVLDSAARLKNDAGSAYDSALVNGLNGQGNTPMSMASWYNNVNIIQYLVSRRANPNRRCKDGQLPLCIAAYHGHQQVCQALLNAGADPTIKHLNKTAADWAVVKNRPDIAGLINAWTVLVCLFRFMLLNRMRVQSAEASVPASVTLSPHEAETKRPPRRASRDVEVVLPARYTKVRTLHRTRRGQLILASRDNGLIGSTMVAIKASLLSETKKAPEESVVECEILLELQTWGKHSNITRILDEFKTERHHCVVMEFVDGGDLFTFVANHARDSGDQLIPDQWVRHWFMQLLAGVQFCHAVGVAHLHLKPENLVLTSSKQLKICDFALSCKVREPDVKLLAQIGSPKAKGLLASSSQPEGKTVIGDYALRAQKAAKMYLAPEVFDGKPFDPIAADIYSCGVILYVMLTCTPPYEVPARTDERFRWIMDGRLDEMLRYFNFRDRLNPLAVDLLKHILMPEKQRYTMAQIVNHPWILGDAAHAKATSGPPTASQSEAETKAQAAAGTVSAASDTAKTLQAGLSSLILDAGEPDMDSKANSDPASAPPASVVCVLTAAGEAKSVTSEAKAQSATIEAQSAALTVSDPAKADVDVSGSLSPASTQTTAKPLDPVERA